MVIPFARSLTPQIARKANALIGCDKNERSLCCAPWHRRMTTTGVARLADGDGRHAEMSGYLFLPLALVHQLKENGVID